MPGAGGDMANLLGLYDAQMGNTERMLAAVKEQRSATMLVSPLSLLYGWQLHARALPFSRYVRGSAHRLQQASTPLITGLP